MSILLKISIKNTDAKNRLYILTRVNTAKRLVEKYQPTISTTTSWDSETFLNKYFLS